MKKPTLLFTILLLSQFALWAQNQVADFDAAGFKKDMLKINKKGMIVLGSWAGANIVSGAIGAATADGSAKYFHQMNLAWGVVNGGLAAMSLFRKEDGKTHTLGEIIQKQHGIEKLFLINAGLDLAYIGTGAWMLKESKLSSRKPERWRGFGNSLLLQGGFLLLFDGIMYGLHSRHGKKLFPLPDKMSLSVGPMGATMVVKI